MVDFSALFQGDQAALRDAQNIAAFAQQAAQLSGFDFRAKAISRLRLALAELAISDAWTALPGDCSA